MPGKIPPRLYPIFASKIAVIIIGCILYKRLTPPYRLIFLHVILATVVEALGAYLNYIKQPSNAWLFNIYMIIEFWMMAWAGKMFLQQQNVEKYIIWILSAFTAYWAISFGFKQTNGSILNVFSITSSLFLVALYVWVLFSNLSFIKGSVFSNPLFYVCLSCLLYFACLIPMLGLINYLYKINPNMANSLFDITVMLNYVRYGLVAISFYLCSKHTKNYLR